MKKKSRKNRIIWKKMHKNENSIEIENEMND